MAGTTEGAYKAWITKRAGGGFPTGATSGDVRSPTAVERSGGPVLEKFVPDEFRVDDLIHSDAYHMAQADWSRTDKTPIEREAYSEFIADGFGSINSYLRDKGDGEPEDQMVPKLAEAIMSLSQKMPPTHEDTLVYRFQGTPRGLDQVGTGGEFKVVGLYSTAQDPSRVRGFMKEGGVAMEIYVPKGSKGVIRGYNPEETEWTFPHGARFEVVQQTEHDSLRYGGVQYSKPLKVFRLKYLGAAT